MLANALDVILVLVLIEAVTLVVLFRQTGRGIPPRALLATLSAGFFVMLALRFALAGASHILIAALLLAALAGHVADLGGRWRGG